MVTRYWRLWLLIFFALSLLFPTSSLNAAGQIKKPREIKRIEAKRILKHAVELGAVNPHLVLAIVERESAGNRYAKYPPNTKEFRRLAKRFPVQYEPTYGLMQLKFGTAKLVGFEGDVPDLYNWRRNLKYGVRYLNYQLKRYRGKVPAAVAAYNAGTAYICSRKCRRGQYVNQAYVDFVMAEYKKAKARYRIVRN